MIQMNCMKRPEQIPVSPTSHWVKPAHPRRLHQLPIYFNFLFFLLGELAGQIACQIGMKQPLQQPHPPRPALFCIQAIRIEQGVVLLRRQSIQIFIAYPVSENLAGMKQTDIEIFSYMQVLTKRKQLSDVRVNTAKVKIDVTKQLQAKTSAREQIEGVHILIMM